MKRIFKTFLLAIAGAALLCGCNFLDVNPELGLTEEDVFTTYKNYKLFFDTLWSDDGEFSKTNLREGFPMYVDFNDRRFVFATTTDAADAGRLLRPQTEIKICNLSQETCNDFSFGNRRPIAKAMFKSIRICNLSIENIGMLTNAKPQEKADLLGQAYFARGFAHFVLCRFYGGMPYIDRTDYDDWDLERLSAYETYVRAAEDFQTAYTYLKEAGKMRRDALPGVAGHLTASDIGRPNGCTALAFRARALLYAASPLNNREGSADWQKAADACAEALRVALEWQYALQPWESYTDNFFGMALTNEVLWGYHHRGSSSHANYTGFFCYPQSNVSSASGLCPTQNFVDRYETRQGDPLLTEADRTAAIAAGHFNDQDPYSNLDPRFETTIVHDGSTTPYVEGAINIHYDPETDSWPSTLISGVASSFGIAWGTNDGKGYSNTGYYCRKTWRGARGDKEAAYQHLDPLIRLAELYLNYAEAVNEAYGPEGHAGGIELSALDAVNLIRARAQMPPVQSRFTGSREAFRERIYNERDVELAFEGNHYYFDIRRWKVAPERMTRTLEGMYIQSCPVDEAHPKGRIYERRAIPANRQCTWREQMYWWPFPDEQANKLINFVNNQRWQ